MRTAVIILSSLELLLVLAVWGWSFAVTSRPFGSVLAESWPFYLVLLAACAVPLYLGLAGTRLTLALTLAIVIAVVFYLLYGLAHTATIAG